MTYTPTRKTGFMPSHDAMGAFDGGEGECCSFILKMMMSYTLHVLKQNAKTFVRAFRKKLFALSVHLTVANFA